MDRRPRTTALWLVLLALGGLLAGHLASYFVVAPDAHDRARLLELTGHSGHGAFGTLALAATFAAVIGLFMQRIRSRGAGGLLGGSHARVAVCLWAAQTAGFVALESWERGHGPAAGLAELAHEPAFLIGLLAQLLVALAATAIVMLVRATAAALLRLFVAPSEVSGVVEVPGRTATRPRSSLSRSAWNLRGPPAPAVLAS